MSQKQSDHPKTTKFNFRRVIESHHVARERYVKRCRVNILIDRAQASPTALSPNLSFFISLILSEKLTSSTADYESGPRKGIAAGAQLTSGQHTTTEVSIIQLAIFSQLSFIVIVSMF